MPAAERLSMRSLALPARQIGEDPAGCVRERILAIERAAREQLVHLAADAMQMPASGLCRCRQIDADLRCKGWQADDSDHRGEFAASAAVSGADRLRLSLAPGYRPRRGRVYLAVPGERKPRPLAISRRRMVCWRHSNAKAMAPSA